MKAENYKEIYIGYAYFALYLTLAVFMTVICVYRYKMTYATEMKKITAKTEEYDIIYMKQTEITHKMDSLYSYMMMFNSNLNDLVLQDAVSNRKLEILKEMENMNEKDVRLHKKLASEINTFLAVKDSISKLKIEEDMVRADLIKCVEDNKKATRKLTVGGIPAVK